MNLYKNNKIQDKFDSNFTKSKLEIIKELEKTEETIVAFKRQKNLLNSDEHIICSNIVFQTKTKDFTDKGSDQPIIFDKELMKHYITDEIEALESKALNLINKLK